MLHSFWYRAAEEPSAMCWHRIRTARSRTGASPRYSCRIRSPAPGRTPKQAASAQAAIDEGRRVPPKTQRERDYIEAVGAYYKDFSSRSEGSRQASRAQAFEELAARYPDDDEAQIFSALYIAGTQSQADQTYATYLKAAAILEKMFVKYPDHPGVAHYLIHSYDAPPIAQKGLPRHGAMRASPRTRRTRCTCLRTSSRALAPGRSRSQPTCVRRRPRRRRR